MTTMSANWTGFSDALSGLASFEYSIGSEAGGTQVSGWTNIAQDTSMIDSSLTLLSGYQYFVNIRAIDQAENTSSVASSNGVNTDNIPPEITAAYDGSATADQEFQQDSTAMMVGWAADQPAATSTLVACWCKVAGLSLIHNSEPPTPD